MKIRQLLGKRSRRFPIQRDEFGDSLRKRCFEHFYDGDGPSETAELEGAKLSTVRTYYRDWKKEGPDFEKFYDFLRNLLDKDSLQRNQNLSPVAELLGIKQEELEKILQQPHGLKRLLRQKFRFPIDDQTDRKLHIALELAILFSEHLVARQGKLTDVYRAFLRFMNEEMASRRPEEKQIADNNRIMAAIHKKLAEDMQRESARPDQFTGEEIEYLVHTGKANHLKEIEAEYWKKVVEAMSGGLTRVQAREAAIRELEVHRKPEEAATLRHLLKTIDPGV